MTDQPPATILALASYHKGEDFLRECKRQGARVLLLTVESLADADWPRESIDELYHMPDLEDRERLLNGVSFLGRRERIDRVVALDEFDLESAALLREHLRVPGMGETAVRGVRDKLVMRERAAAGGVLEPEFTGVVNDARVGEFLGRVPPPWVLKPRTSASAVGIKKTADPEEVWRTLDALGDRRSHHLLEHYIPGTVYHVDAIVAGGEVRFAEVHGYATPPFDIMHGGGIFASRTLERDSEDASRLRSVQQDLVRAFGIEFAVMHTEFIKGDDGQYRFLETAARVGGANIAEMVEAATGVNLWREWARLEVAQARGAAYEVPTSRRDYAGILVSLARQEWPDTSAYDAPEVVWRMHKRHHAGLIVASPDPERVLALLEEYTARFYHDFHASLPAPDRPTS